MPKSDNKIENNKIVRLICTLDDKSLHSHSS